jgi:hypothetical protein
MKDEKAIDWKERFPQLPLDKENKLKEGSWEAWVKGVFFYLVFFLEEEENECVKGELIVICEKVLFMEVNVCKQKNMGGSCV